MNNYTVILQSMYYPSGGGGEGGHHCCSDSPEQSLRVGDNEPDPTSMAEVAKPLLLIERGLRQNHDLEPLDDIFREFSLKQLHSDVAV